MDMLNHHQEAGSHRPLDIETHWSWRNPLNAIPLTLLFLVVLALISATVTEVGQLAPLLTAGIWGGQ
jgi:hypothetical protein